MDIDSAIEALDEAMQLAGQGRFYPNLRMGDEMVYGFLMMKEPWIGDGATAIGVGE